MTDKNTVKKVGSIVFGCILVAVFLLLFVFSRLPIPSVIGNFSVSETGEQNETVFSGLKKDRKREEQPIVYYTKEISSESLIKIYETLQYPAVGERVAVKISTGENGSNYLRPELIGGLVRRVNGTIVECNTAYGGNRSSTAMHYQLAAEHGYTEIAEVAILDGESDLEIPVYGGKHLQTNQVGAGFAEYDFYVVVSHFKGHIMAGYGGALKNISIGLASSTGKCRIHTAGASNRTIYGAEQDDFLESMAEAAKSVCDYLDGRILFINVMNNLSVDCDCDSNPAEPTMHDIGILASTDPVALDKACIDLVYAAQDSADLIQRIESKNGAYILEYAAEIGLGSTEYNLVNIDD